MRRRRPLSVKPTNTKRKLESLDPNFQSSVEERLKNLQCVLNIVDSNSNTSNENQLVAPNSRKRRKLNNDNESAQRFCKLLNDADAEFDFTHENKIEKNDKENEDDELQIIFPKENATKPQKYSAMKTISTNYVKQNLKRRFRRFRTRRPRRKKIEPVDIQPSVETAEEEKQNLSEEELEVIEQMSSGGREIKIQYGSPEEVANDDEKLSTILKKYFNHESFRPGQKEVIKRILLGKSTLAILPTGSGKSLLYQFPALIYPNIALIITPLISLMADQLQLLPMCLPGALLSVHLTKLQREKIYEKAKSGKIKVLFISPERLNNDKFIQMLKNELPPVSFACIDEAHCVSEWSHNFRPSYLHLKDVLCEKLGVKTILALTATATRATEKSVCESLRISFPDGVIRTPLARPNLNITISRTTNKFSDIVRLLESERFLSCNSIIIYVMTKSEADGLANHLKMKGFDAVSYHAGLKKSSREKIQQQFISNEVRIIVATNASFGMGINKPDVSAVIHFSMPRSLENYIQEIGRAGRDLKCSAQCHLLLDTEDYYLLRSLSYSDSVNEVTVKRLLSAIFSADKRYPCEIALSISKLEQTLDVKEEVISTMLSYLDLHQEKYIRVLPTGQNICTLKFTTTPDKTINLVASIIKLAQRIQSTFRFDISDIANDLGMTLDEVLSALTKLKESGEVKYKLTEDAFFIRVNKKPKDLPALCVEIAKKMRELEQCKLFKLHTMFRTARQFSEENFMKAGTSKPGLQAKIEEYFTSLTPHTTKNIKLFKPFNELPKTHQDSFLADTNQLILENPDMPLNGNMIARIFHGISSPLIAADRWSRHRMWRRYSFIDYYEIVQQATNIILKNKRLH